MEIHMDDMLLDLTLADIGNRGLNNVVHEKSNDRYFCEQLGLDYSRSDIFTQVKIAIVSYKLMIEEFKW